jgi:hypothetical protein
MFGSWSTSQNTSGTDSSSTSTGQPNNGKPPSYNSIYPKGTPNEFKGPNKVTNNGQNKNGQNKQEEKSNFNSNEGVFSIPIIKEFSNLNTKNIEIAEQEGMIGCSVC